MKSKTILKTVIAIIVIGGGVGYFVYQVMQSPWSYYYSVDEFSANKADVKGSSLRIAGRVKEGTVERDLEKMSLSFILAGDKTEIAVNYEGSVPDNFSENKEVVVQGQMDEKGIFKAQQLLTRCESKYKAKVD